MKKAVIYARYSSAGQRDVSIDDQIREIKEYAKFQNMEIINVYSDPAISGRNAENRPQFLKMVKDSEARAFQFVLVYKHDRFARNQYDAVIYKKRLKDNGVEVIAVKEPIPDGHGAKILESIYTAMAEEYSENLSQNIKRGQKGNALKCLANHKAPFGYKVDPVTHKYIIDEEAGPIVQNCFKMILAGKQNKEVLAYMASIGLPRSKNWLYQVLHNERYTGVYIYADTRIENGMPALISKDDFLKVQEAMKKRAQRPQLKPYKYLFSGLIYCGLCGALMCGESAESHTGTIYRYYTCPAYKKRKQCAKKRISADFIEKKALQALKDVVFSKEVVDRLANDLYHQLNKNSKEKVSGLKKQLAAVEKKLANIIKAIEGTAQLPASLLARMNDLEKEKSELTDLLQSSQLAIDSSSIRKDDLKKFILNFNQSDDNALVNAFVTRLTVFDDYAILEYDASGDNEVRIDFCTASNLVEQNVLYPKFFISNSTLYIQFPLAA